MKKRILFFIFTVSYTVACSFHQLKVLNSISLQYKNIKIFTISQTLRLTEPNKFIKDFILAEFDYNDQFWKQFDSYTNNYLFYNFGYTSTYFPTCKDIEISNKIWIHNRTNQVILSNGNRLLDLQDALTQYFKSDTNQNEKSLRLFKKSKILAVWNLIPNKADNTEGPFLIGLARDNKGHLFHWITELKMGISILMQYAKNISFKDQLFRWLTDIKTDASVLIQYATENKSYYNELCSIFKYYTNLPIRIAKEHYEKEYKLD